MLSESEWGNILLNDELYEDMKSICLPYNMYVCTHTKYMSKRKLWQFLCSPKKLIVSEPAKSPLEGKTSSSFNLQQSLCLVSLSYSAWAVWMCTLYSVSTLYGRFWRETMLALLTINSLFQTQNADWPCLSISALSTTAERWVWLAWK